jgi:hypothetical protein
MTREEVLDLYRDNVLDVVWKARGNDSPEYKAAYAFLATIESQAEELDRLRAELAELRKQANGAETCESGDPLCGPVEYHDSEGVPLCQVCWDGLLDDTGRGSEG